MSFFRVVGNLLRFDRANWKAILLCVLAASVFWLFNAFNKNHVTTIEFPLRFEFDQEKFVPIDELPGRIGINVSGNGWDLFRNQFGLKIPVLVIPLDRPLETKKIVSESLTSVFQPQLEKLTINFLISDTLRLQIDEKDFHKFKVNPDFTDFSFEEGFGRTSPIVILPDSVVLTGPKSLLHQMPDFVSIKIRGESIDQNISEQLEVLMERQTFVVEPPSVKVMFEVGRVIDFKATLKLTSKMKTIPSDSIDVWFRIPAKREEEFRNQLVEMSAMASVQTADKDGVVNPTLRNVPLYAELIRMDSVVVNAPPR
jgi:YbbR domain-containing protein